MLCRGNVMKNAIKNVIKKRSVGFGLVLSLVFDWFLFDFGFAFVLILFRVLSSDRSVALVPAGYSFAVGHA